MIPASLYENQAKRRELRDRGQKWAKLGPNQLRFLRLIVSRYGYTDKLSAGEIAAYFGLGAQQTIYKKRLDQLVKLELIQTDKAGKPKGPPPRTYYLSREGAGKLFSTISYHLYSKEESPQTVALVSSKFANNFARTYWEKFWRLPRTDHGFNSYTDSPEVELGDIFYQLLKLSELISDYEGRVHIDDAVKIAEFTKKNKLPSSSRIAEAFHIQSKDIQWHLRAVAYEIAKKNFSEEFSEYASLKTAELRVEVAYHQQGVTVAERELKSIANVSFRRA